MNLLNKGQDFVEQNFDIKFEILGEPASKANQRKLVKIHNRIVPIKSKKAFRMSMDLRNNVHNLIQ